MQQLTSRGAYQVVGRWIQQLHVHAALARRELNETATRLEIARMLQVLPLRGLRSINSSVFGVLPNRRCVMFGGGKLDGDDGATEDESCKAY